MNKKNKCSKCGKALRGSKAMIAAKHVCRKCWSVKKWGSTNCSKCMRRLGPDNKDGLCYVHSNIKIN